jgi:F0F1-type ATP synthase assembly protein I
LLFLWIGKWLDGKLGTAPWLLIVGAFVGAAAGFYSLYRKVMADPNFGGKDKGGKGRAP